jgi:hypothetical protein
MKIRVGYGCCMVQDFLGVGFDDNQIADELQADVEKIVANSAFIKQTDWELHFQANFTNAREVLVSKNRLGTLPSYKWKEVTIIIPVPYLEVAPWGVKKEQHTDGIDLFDKLMKNFYPLGVNYAAFSNRTDYIMDSMRRGISFSFNTGFTVNKVKVKLNSDQTKLLYSPTADSL